MAGEDIIYLVVRPGKKSRSLRKSWTICFTLLTIVTRDVYFGIFPSFSRKLAILIQTYDSGFSLKASLE